MASQAFKLYAKQQGEVSSSMPCALNRVEVTENQNVDSLHLI